MLQRGLRQEGVVMSRHSESFPASHSDTRPSSLLEVEESWFGPLAAHDNPGPPAPEPVTDVVFQRIYRAFLGTRALMGIGLCGAFWGMGNWGAAAGGVDGVSLGLLLLYTLHAMAVWSWPQLNSLASSGRMSLRQTLSTVLLDILLLLWLTLQGPSWLMVLPLAGLPVMMAGALLGRRAAMTWIALLGIGLLLSSIRIVLLGQEPWAQVGQSALSAAGLVLAVFLTGELADRLAKEEYEVRAHRAAANLQLGINRLVIEAMQEGVLVVDARGEVLALNPAAGLLLAPPARMPELPFSLASRNEWQGLLRLVIRALRVPQGLAPQELSVQHESGWRKDLSVRVRFARAQDDEGQGVVLLFMEDRAAMEERAREVKLAAMGRMSAGVAHEIRNPLAAIAQANALLAEDVRDPASQRLTRMVADNVARLQRVVDDVMEVAPGRASVPSIVDVNVLTREVLADWLNLHPKAQAAEVLVSALPEESIWVQFDPDHWRRVLVNLLDNAWRHCKPMSSAIELRIVHDDEAVLLSVASNGEPLSPEVETHLFEPFFSTRSRGTGLGLYICRELCERYGGTIDYRLRGESFLARNDFFMVLPRVIEV